ncbi:hypothetical protein MCHI_002259 [Candidatus Magnetoovum chiemensis]|nr:hypothetical protein MCHI_002259 [Candidatus Magnetoovum chiemensis]
MINSQDKSSKYASIDSIKKWNCLPSHNTELIDILYDDMECQQVYINKNWKEIFNDSNYKGVHAGVNATYLTKTSDLNTEEAETSICSNGKKTDFTTTVEPKKYFTVKIKSKKIKLSRAVPEPIVEEETEIYSSLIQNDFIVAIEPKKYFTVKIKSKKIKLSRAVPEPIDEEDIKW